MKLIEASSLYHQAGLVMPFTVWIKSRLQTHKEMPLMTYNWRVKSVGKPRLEYLITQTLADKIIAEYNLANKDYEYIELPNSKSVSILHSNKSISYTGKDMNDPRRHHAIRRVIDQVRNQLAKEEEQQIKAATKHKRFYDLMDVINDDPVIKNRVKEHIANASQEDQAIIAELGIDWFITVQTRKPLPVEPVHVIHKEIVNG